MRPFSILTALLVAVTLYLVVMERDLLADISGADAAEGNPDAAGTAPVEPASDAVSVVAVLSRAQQIESAVRLRGRTEAMRQVDVAAETSGRIVSAPLRRGAFVEAGELLCQLDPGTREANLAEAQARLAEAEAARPQATASVASAEARLREARIGQNAASRLSSDGYASDSRVAASDAEVEAALAQIEAARASLESAEAGVEGARAAVAAARNELDRLEIEAPFGGILESDTAELGALLQPGGLCATVIQLAPMKLVGFVPEMDVDEISIGAPAMARLASGREVEGEVTFISRAADPQTRTFRTEITTPNDDLSIRDGQTADIAVTGGGQVAHLLPSSALTLNDDGDLGVRIADAQDVTAFRQVELLRDTPNGVFVAGLDETARVIVTGQEFVTDGVPLDVTLREQSE